MDLLPTSCTCPSHKKEELILHVEKRELLSHLVFPTRMREPPSCLVLPTGIGEAS